MTSAIAIPVPQEFIVAEVCKSWPNSDRETIASLFEHVIGVNLARGYVLFSFTHSSAIAPDQSWSSETIIAVFRRAVTP
ncbi:MAG: hypothetical protein WAT39_23870 [Planctomycetota bacterium]